MTYEHTLVYSPFTILNVLVAQQFSVIYIKQRQLCLETVSAHTDTVTAFRRQTRHQTVTHGVFKLKYAPDHTVIRA